MAGRAQGRVPVVTNLFVPISVRGVETVRPSRETARRTNDSGQAFSQRHKATEMCENERKLRDRISVSLCLCEKKTRPNRRTQANLAEPIGTKQQVNSGDWTLSTIT